MITKYNTMNEEIIEQEAPEEQVVETPASEEVVDETVPGTDVSEISVADLLNNVKIPPQNPSIGDDFENFIERDTTLAKSPEMRAMEAYYSALHEEALKEGQSHGPIYDYMDGFIKTHAGDLGKYPIDALYQMYMKEVGDNAALATAPNTFKFILQTCGTNKDERWFGPNLQPKSGKVPPADIEYFPDSATISKRFIPGTGIGIKAPNVSYNVSKSQGYGMPSAAPSFAMMGADMPQEEAEPVEMSAESAALDNLLSDQAEDLMSVASRVHHIFDEIESTAYTFLRQKDKIQKSYCISGGPGIGKSYSVALAVNDVLKDPKGFDKLDRAQAKGLQIPGTRDRLVLIQGAAGGGMTAASLVFTRYAKNFAIIFDDCDQILNSGSNELGNFLKGIFEAKAHAKSVKIPEFCKSAIISEYGFDKKDFKFDFSDLENDEDDLDEGVVPFMVNYSKLAENKLCLVNTRSGEEINLSLKAGYAKKLCESYGIPRNETWATLHENLLDDDDELDVIDDEDLSDAAAVQNNMNDDDRRSLKDQLEEILNTGHLIFTSRVLFITNLEWSKVDEAVASRTYHYDVQINDEEFMFRLGEVLSHITAGHDATPDVLKAREVIYAFYQFLYEHSEKGQPIILGGQKIFVKFSPQARQIRTFEILMNKYIASKDFWIRKEQKRRTTAGDTRLVTDQEADDALKLDFLIRTMLPYITGQKIIPRKN